MDPDEDGSNVGPTQPLTLDEFRRAFAQVHADLGMSVPDDML